MILWIVIIACAVLMYKIAEMERLSGIVWAVLTLALCIGCVFLIRIPFINAVIGLALSFIAMTAYNAKFGEPY
jgi:RsiW-degrading membrane proteinase PrsW (M82 family)